MRVCQPEHAVKRQQINIMSARSPKDRSRSPHYSPCESALIKQSQQQQHSNEDNTSNSIESTANQSKAKKDNESQQQRFRNLKVFIQTLVHESPPLGSTYEEQIKALENACVDEYRDLSLDRIRRMIRGIVKQRKSSPSTHTPFLHQVDQTNHHNNLQATSNDRPNSNGNNPKKSRSVSIPNHLPTKTADLVTSPTSTLSALDADFLRHAFSQQFRPSLDLSAYFSASPPATTSNSNSSLFRPNFSTSNFLQTLTNTSPLAPPLPSMVSAHSLTNGTSDASIAKSSKQIKLASAEASSIKVLVNAYREAASYLCRSADELEQLI